MKKIVFLLTFIIMAATVVDAQIIDPRKTAKRKAEQRTNQKIDESIDKALDKVFGGFGKKDKDKSANDSDDNSSPTTSGQDEDASAAMGKLFGSLGLGGATPPAESYTFNSSYVMRMKSQGKKKDENYTMEMKYMFNDGGKVMGSKILSADNPELNKQVGMMEAIIFDWEKSQMYNFMNMNGQKQYMGIAIKGGTIGDAMESQYEKTTFTKLGKTKTIAGYVCDAYLNDDGKTQSTVWVSREPIPSVARYYDAFNRMSANQQNQMKMAYQTNPEMMKMVKEGRAMLGMEMTDDGNQMEMEVIKISPSDNYTFNATGYSSMMDMNAIMKQAEQAEKN